MTPTVTRHVTRPGSRDVTHTEVEKRREELKTSSLSASVDHFRASASPRREEEG